MSSQSLPSTLYQVTWFNKRKGYGFVTGDIFVHHSDIQVSGYKYLKQGEYITGEVTEGAKKKLINIRAPMEGGQLMCEIDGLVRQDRLGSVDGLGRQDRLGSVDGLGRQDRLGSTPDDVHGLGRVGRLGSAPDEVEVDNMDFAPVVEGHVLGRVSRKLTPGGNRPGRFDGHEPDMGVPGVVRVRKGPLYEKVIHRPRPTTPRN